MADFDATPAESQDDEEGMPEGSLRNIVESTTLKWIFVGGKGGVGKTTTSTSIALRIARRLEEEAAGGKVLVVSTDPAHNLSDAFGQKFGRDPVAVAGVPNLFAQEVDAAANVEELATVDDGADADGMGGLNSIMSELTTAIPGIDEAMSFAELMKQVTHMDFSVIVFDTAPTGHTLRLLSFPTTLERAFSKLMGLKSRFGGLFSQFGAMMGGDMPDEDMLLGRLDQTREVIEKVNLQFKDPTRTTFVCVCIPEFLSLYETERLVQELSKFEIDTHNIVVNQVLFPDKDADELVEWYKTEKPELSSEAQGIIGITLARKRMQDKYVSQIFDLYEDFNVTLMPLLDREVRGVPSLESFSLGMLGSTTEM